MNAIPGYGKLVEKVPEIASPRGFVRALVTVLIPAAVVVTVLVLAETVSPLLALILQIVVYMLTFWLIGQAVNGRKLRLPYSDAFFVRFLPAAGLNLASALYVLFGGGWILGEDYVRLVPKALGALGALYLIVTGALLLARSIRVAGVDTLFLVYNYYPDEGRRLSSAMYRLIRHPVYAAIDRVVLALALWNGSTFAMLMAVLFVFAWHPRWYGVEEAELLERFGDEYRSYRERVPAVFPSGTRGEVALLEAITRRGPEPAGDEAGAPIG